MRVRKVAKQLKLFHKNVTFDKDGYPVCHYKIANHSAKTDYIMRMTRKHYFGLAKKHDPNSMIGRLYIHNACNPFLYEEIMEFWGINLYE